MNLRPLLFLLPGLLFADPFSGELRFDLQAFPNDGAYGQSAGVVPSVVLQPEWSHSWDQGRRVVTFTPFIRWDAEDEERTHADLREFSFEGSWARFDLRVGVSKVFWGVTESQHLVDVINQTDGVENLDGEDKLGQPMIQWTGVFSWGDLSLFYLPYFRERTFPGADGRYRTERVVDGDEARYLFSEEQWHPDVAARWSHYLGGLDWGLSYFRGVDREPGLEPLPGTEKLRPVYGLSEQWGLELQYLHLDTLFKAELLRKDSDVQGDYNASVVGVEHTFPNSWMGMDIGLLYEWLWDERGRDAGSGLDDASFVGTRLAVNDAASTEVLFGAFVDHESGGILTVRLEASRRLSDHWSLNLEGSLFPNPPEGSFFHQIQEDDNLLLSLSYFW